MNTPNIDPIMKFFECTRLDDKERAVAKPFAELAEHLVQTLPRNAERTVALRKLLEGREAALRAAMPE
jgi:hypothetical protein